MKLQGFVGILSLHGHFATAECLFGREVKTLSDLIFKGCSGAERTEGRSCAYGTLLQGYGADKQLLGQVCG